MNYLAHIYLSGNNDLVTLGNFIADGVKGKAHTNYQPYVQAGILLHRHIDSFTDNHPIVRQSTKRLHKNYSHYSGIIVDIFYDHFLAKNWKQYSDIALDVYINTFYTSLKTHYAILPQRIKHMMPFMIEANWLLSYATTAGIANVLEGMNRRTNNRSGMHLAINELELFYEDFENEFTLFFKALIATSANKLQELTKGLSAK